MSGFLLTLHVIVSVLLVAVILLQPGAKGGGLGASFGGGGANSAFGARGSAPFLAKFTYYLAAGVMATSLVIEALGPGPRRGAHRGPRPQARRSRPGPRFHRAGRPGTRALPCPSPGRAQKVSVDGCRVPWHPA
jgi:protein translocase SecG subunit